MALSGYRPHLLGLVAAVVGAIVSIGPAHAQWTLEPAFTDGRMQGAEAAKGAVIWNHGRSVTTEDSLSPTPYYMSVLRDAGWDAYRFNRLRDGDTLPDSTRALVAQVHELKQRGYRKVVLTGQSFGAFLSLMAADATDEVHAVVATAPAAFGSFSEFYDSWRANATRLYPLLEKVRNARVMLFFFHGDDFDPGGRGEHARAILAAHKVEHMVVDQPAYLTGHWAASTGLFVRRFGSCIRDFVEAERVSDDASCEAAWGQKPSTSLALPANFSSSVSKRPVTAQSGTAQSSLAGKWYGFYSNGREVMLAIENVRGDEVTAIYAIGPGIQAGQNAEWVRRTGKVVDDEIVFREKGRNTLRYRLRGDGQLAATWQSLDGHSSMETTLRRID
jgi:dienelactone hydrolase